MATFGELLQELRKDHRLSQKQLADVIAVTTGTVSNYENNQHLPDIEKLIMLADYFGVTTDYLLGRSISRLPPDIFEEQLVPGKSMSSILNYLIQKDRLSSLKSIWPKLDTRSQNLLEAKYILGKLDSDIAKELDIKEASVRMALSRARKKAYELIKRDAGIDTY